MARPSNPRRAPRKAPPPRPAPRVPPPVRGPGGQTRGVPLHRNHMKRGRR